MRSTGPDLHPNTESGDNVIYSGNPAELPGAQEIVVPWISTEDNDADFFTKPLPPKRFKMLRRKVMNLR